MTDDATTINGGILTITISRLSNQSLVVGNFNSDRVLVFTIIRKTEITEIFPESSVVRKEVARVDDKVFPSLH